MRKIALILGDNFPVLKQHVLTQVKSLLKLPNTKIFTRDLNSCKKILTIEKQANIASLMTFFEEVHEYTYGFIILATQEQIHQINQVQELEHPWFIVEDEKKWFSFVNKRLNELFYAEPYMVEDIIETIGKRNLYDNYRVANKISSSLEETNLYDLSTPYNLCDYELAYEFSNLLQAENNNNLGIVYNTAYPGDYFAEMIVYPSLKNSFLSLDNHEKILFIKINSISANTKSVGGLLKDHFQLPSDLITNYIKRNLCKVLMMIHYNSKKRKSVEEALTQNKIYQLIEIIKHNTEIPLYTIHLLNEEQQNIVSSRLQFDFVRKYQKVNEYQVERNIILNIEDGEVDVELVRLNSDLLQVLQVPECLEEILSNLQRHLLGYSPVFPIKVYEQVIQKYYPPKGKQKFKQSLFKQIDDSLRKEIIQAIDMGKCKVSEDEEEFKIIMTVYLAEQLEKKGWKELKLVIELVKNKWSEIYFWGTSLYLASLIKKRDVNTFLEFAQWQSDPKLFSIAFRYNNIFGSSSTRLFLEKLANNDPEIAEYMHKVVMQNYLTLGFYKNAADILSYLKKYYPLDKKKMLERFQKMLGQMNQNKFSLVSEQNYYDLYEYYFGLNEEDIEKVKSQIKDSENGTYNWIFAVELLVESYTTIECLIVREYFYDLLQPPNIEQIDYNYLEKIIDFYGDFCLEKGYLGDYKIMIEHLLKRIYYAAHTSSPEGKLIRERHVEMLLHIEAKLKMLQLK